MIGIEGTFDVAGARAALAYFSALAPERLGHAYLFTGPAGVGKKTFARRFAQSLLCETPKATLLGYCGHCPGCRLFVAGTHPDFIGNEGTIRIGDESGSALHDETVTARDLIRAVALQGYRSRFRVVLLGDVRFATHESANALLKLFEDPPSGVVALLTTSAPGALLETIRSRFVQLAFEPLSTADVARVLTASGIPDERARRAAAASLGSITRARTLLEENGDPDAGARDRSFAWFAAAMNGAQADAGFLRLDDRSLTGAEKRARVGDLIEIVRIGARDWAALATGDERVPLLAPDQRHVLARIAPREPRAMATVLAAAADAQGLAATNVSAGLVVEFLRIGLAPASAPHRTS